MVIRPAESADAERLAALHLTVWDEAYSGLIDPELLAARRARPAQERTARWLARLAMAPTIVAERDDRLVGFAMSGPGRDVDDPTLPGMELMSLYVRAEVYGAGYGHALLREALGEEPAYLWVLDGNTRAERFYRRQGFEYDGSRRQDPYGLERRMRRG